MIIFGSFFIIFIGCMILAAMYEGKLTCQNYENAGFDIKNNLFEGCKNLY